jgi:hypothetical protein
MTERDRVYVQILHYGIVSLRNASLGGNSRYCQVESEHLHNIPSLIGETNEARHAYYFDGERASYLEHVDHSAPESKFALARYKELWAELEELRMQQLAASPTPPPANT